MGIILVTYTLLYYLILYKNDDIKESFFSLIGLDEDEDD